MSNHYQDVGLQPNEMDFNRWKPLMHSLLAKDKELNYDCLFTCERKGVYGLGTWNIVSKEWQVKHVLLNKGLNDTLRLVSNNMQLEAYL